MKLVRLPTEPAPCEPECRGQTERGHSHLRKQQVQMIASHPYHAFENHILLLQEWYIVITGLLENRASRKKQPTGRE